MDGSKRIRVFNKTKYDIGVTLMSGQKPNIKRDSFLSMTVDDILYIESIATGRRPFSSGELVPVTDDGKELTLEDLGGYTDVDTVKHFGDEEIEANLKKSAKNIEGWLAQIDDPIELHAIMEVAKTMDLPQSKLKILQAKMPNRDLLSE